MRRAGAARWRQPAARAAARAAAIGLRARPAARAPAGGVHGSRGLPMPCMRCNRAACPPHTACAAVCGRRVRPGTVQECACLKHAWQSTRRSHSKPMRCRAFGQPHGSSEPVSVTQPCACRAAHVCRRQYGASAGGTAAAERAVVRQRGSRLPRSWRAYNAPNRHYCSRHGCHTTCQVRAGGWRGGGGPRCVLLLPCQLRRARMASCSETITRAHMT